MLEVRGYGWLYLVINYVFLSSTELCFLTSHMSVRNSAFQSYRGHSGDGCNV